MHVPICVPLIVSPCHESDDAWRSKFLLVPALAAMSKMRTQSKLDQLERPNIGTSEWHLRQISTVEPSNEEAYELRTCYKRRQSEIRNSGTADAVSHLYSACFILYVRQMKVMKSRAWHTFKEVEVHFKRIHDISSFFYSDYLRPPANVYEAKRQ